MNKIAFLALGLFVACTTTRTPVAETEVQKQANPVPYATTITQDELKEHLYLYASDEFEGREAGTPGQKKAVAYLKSQYEALGIPAAKQDGNYFQNVPLEEVTTPTGSITINTTTFAVGEEVITFATTQGQYSELVYVGYGIEADGYSDYNGLNVEDKLVLLKAGEPTGPNNTYLLSGTQEPSVWSASPSEALEKKLTLAQEKGAKGILYFDPLIFPQYKEYFGFVKNEMSHSMVLKEDIGNNSIFFLSTKAAKALKKDIEQNATPQTLSTNLTFNIQNKNNTVNSENVVAFIQGSEKPQEYIVLSAHLDHIGVTPDGQINNGADDDGSGTVALLEIAEAFTKAAAAGHRPKRSIVFLHVTAEEKGLLGSQYYTDYDPVFPLPQTVANLNIDMIGRIDPKREGDRNYLYLIGSDKLSTELHQLSEAVNNTYTKLELDYTYNDENDPNRFYYRSDHYNFAKHNIPIIFYFNGTHEDYHQPSDTPDKISYDLLENRTRLIFHTAWELANRANRIVVDQVPQ